MTLREAHRWSSQVLQADRRIGNVWGDGQRAACRVRSRVGRPGCHPSQNGEQRQLRTRTFNAARVHVDFHNFRCRFPDQAWLSIPSSSSSIKSVGSVAEQYESACVTNMQKDPQIAFHLNRNMPRMLAARHGWRARLDNSMASSSRPARICAYSD